MLKKFSITVLAAFSIMLIGEVNAQTLGRVESTESNAPDYFYYVQPGERTVQVHVIGAVKTPGLYEVGSDMSLGQLLALSGGPTMNPRQRRNKRNVEVRVVRSGAAIYTADIESPETPYVQFGTMQEGDIVRVDVVERSSFSWRDGLQILTAVASVALIYDRVQN